MPILWLLSLLSPWLAPLHGAEPATSYVWGDRISTYRAYWDDPRPLLAEAERLLTAINPDKDPRRWLEVFCAYGMSNDAIHHMPGIAQHILRAKRIAARLDLWEHMIDALIIEGSFLESLTVEDLAAMAHEFGSDVSAPYEKALAIAQEHKSLRNTYLVIGNYKGYLKYTGQSTRIMKLLEHAPEHVQSARDLADIDRLNLKKNLVFLYKIANQHEGVAQVTRELADACETVPYRALCTYMLHDYGVLLASGRIPIDYPKAIEILEKAESMAADLDDVVIQGLAALTLAQIAQAQKKPEEAIHHARRAASHARRMGYYSTVGEAVLIEADNYRRLKRHAEAIRILAELKRDMPSNLYSQHTNLHKLAADIHSEMQSWQQAYEERTLQTTFERKYIEERSQENFSEHMVKLGLQLEQEKNKALTSENELQERERKTIIYATSGIVLIAIFLLCGLIWVSRKNREIRKLHRFIETQVLQRFLPPRIVSDILSGKSHFEQNAQHRVVTVLFADLVNFTKSAERMQPHDLTELLNGFFADMSEVVFAHGGVIDKFIGDAIMVVFGAPQELTPAEQAEASTRCALQLVECLQRLNIEWQQRFNTTFAMRIGVHQGPGVVGAFGSERRSDYTVIGHTVNLASRIEGQAMPNQILVSESVARFLTDAQKSYAGSFRLKGIEQPVALFAVRTAPAIAGEADRSAS
ncbi:adenylate/guanylate cyclase domain-containing protein [Oligoflexus tunisiensis]|uniref:adenylate/guanylate cyclase domain-containing protein n=1 Tax=Oligoflexus tunisiensis TaxID=708132 RepID=UPI001C401FF9|nr:adenylate/guanylate cyclase domain-containing protein [Oligoflexus tunisiensis]